MAAREREVAAREREVRGHEVVAQELVLVVRGPLLARLADCDQSLCCCSTRSVCKHALAARPHTCDASLGRTESSELGWLCEMLELHLAPYSYRDAQLLKLSEMPL